MADFQVAYNIIHSNEGGYANVQNDKGGETYCGIARVYWPKWHGWQLIDGWKAAVGRQPHRYEYIDATGLMDEVIAFYKRWWTGISGDQIRSQPVANQLYDFSIGTGKAVEIAQEVLISMGYQLKADNAFGPATLAALNVADPNTFYNKLKAARIAYYYHLVDRDPTQKVHLDGWLARANRFVELQKKTASQLSQAA